MSSERSDHTAALIRLRGNWALSDGGRIGLPVDLVDLSSHDLCAWARGPHEVRVGLAEFGWPPGTGATRSLEGSMFRSPSPRGVTPNGSSPIRPHIDRSTNFVWLGGRDATMD